MIALFSMSIYPRKGGSAVVTEELARCFARNELIVVGGRKLFQRPHPRDKDAVNVLSLGSELNVRGRGDRFFESFRWLLFPWHLARATAFCRLHHCTSVVATFPDELFLYLGLLVAKRLGVPFFAYFHNTLVENRVGWRAAVARRIQARAFSNAVRVFVISDGLKRFYGATYPEVDFFTIPHVFDQFQPARSRASDLTNAGPRTVALCGNFNNTNLDATRRVIDALHVTGNYRIILYTPVPRLLLKMRGIDVEKVASIKYVPDSEFMSCLAEADLLVLTHGLSGALSDVEYRTIFPTRTVPLLLSGRPLLVHAPKHSFLAEFIREHGCGLVVDEADDEALRAAAKILVSDDQFTRTLTVRAAQVASMFRGASVRSRLLQAINATVNRAG